MYKAFHYSKYIISVVPFDSDYLLINGELIPF